MSDGDWGFATPPFNVQEALQRLKRDLREMGLVERGQAWERRGLLLVQLSTNGTQIDAQRVKRPARSSPEWLHKTLKSSADVRDFSADLKRQLALWNDDHD